jgi:hypothetical protein
MRFNQTTLEKLEQIIAESHYLLRYERGTFQSGYCILEQRRVVVLNRFLQTEGRVSALVDIIPQLQIRPEGLSPDLRHSYEEAMTFFARQQHA